MYYKNHQIVCTCIHRFRLPFLRIKMYLLVGLREILIDHMLLKMHL